MPDTVRFNIVDVFTDRAFAGNQLAVFVNAVGLTTEQMQALAREMNFSESTFVLPPERGGDVRIRIFTPEQELPFAGHPTLGTAFVLALPMQRTLIRLETGSGIVPVTLEREGARIIFGLMEQPIPRMEVYDRADDLIAALGVGEVVTSLPVELYDNGVPHVYVELSSADQVAWLEPDFGRLARFGADRHQLLRRPGNAGEDAVLRAHDGRSRGPRDRLRRRSAGPAPGTARPTRVGERAGDLAGRGGRPDRPRSSRGSTAPATRWSGSRWAARR